jgi:hypothetical protein
MMLANRFANMLANMHANTLANAPIAGDSARDPALVGRELGPWMMVPWWVTVPPALVVGATLVWYFVRLGRAEVPRERRWIRRASIVFAGASIAPLVRGLTFVHPHEDRVGFAVAWSAVLFTLMPCLLLALVDVFLTTRRGLREFQELRRETLVRRPEERSNG